MTSDGIRQRITSHLCRPRVIPAASRVTCPVCRQVTCDDDGEKVIRLTRPALCSVLSEQLVTVLQAAGVGHWDWAAP